MFKVKRIIVAVPVAISLVTLVLCVWFLRGKPKAFALLDALSNWSDYL